MFRAVSKASEQSFTLVHRNDESKNVNVGFEIGENGQVTWSGIPQSIMTLLKSMYEDKFMQKYPDVALRAILVEAQQQVEGFRPIEEIRAVLDQAC